MLGRVRVADRAEAAPIDIRVLAAIDAFRRQMHARIRALLPGEIGAIASALVTGIRDEISPEVNEAMRVSGLAHVLSISGLHMVLAVGALFALVRGVLALIPGLALRRPVKKWAALVALAGATGYLILSGAAVPTQRAYIMIAIVLAGVLIDRPALTIRTLAVAAAVLLALEPEAILHPSFQMSFAATLALVALFELLGPSLAGPPTPGSGILGRFSERIGRWLLLGALTSLAAGLATTAYAAFHFHRLAPFGLIANLLAMPVISFIIMPAALFSVLLMPFGYDALGWQAMGFGIELMLSIARWVAALAGRGGTGLRLRIRSTSLRKRGPARAEPACFAAAAYWSASARRRAVLCVGCSSPRRARRGGGARRCGSRRGWSTFDPGRAEKPYRGRELARGGRGRPQTDAGARGGLHLRSRAMQGTPERWIERCGDAGARSAVRGLP